MTAVLAPMLCLLGLFELLQFVSLLPGAGGYAVAVHASLAVLSLWAAWGTWRRSHWAPRAVLLLGLAIALARLLEGFVLGTRPWFVALIAALGWGTLAVLFAGRVRREGAEPAG